MTLPAPVAPWAFRIKTTETADKILSSADAAGVQTGPVSKSMLQRMLRATLLDTRVFREVAADPRLHREAWIVALAVIILSSVGLQILTLRILSGNGIITVLSTCVVQVAAWLARVWVIQYAAKTWFETTVNFRPLFRALAYAQAPVALLIVPVVGQVVPLWSLITSTAAIQDVTACRTKTAVILAIVGAVGVSVAAAATARVVSMIL